MTRTVHSPGFTLPDNALTPAISPSGNTSKLSASHARVPSFEPSSTTIISFETPGSAELYRDVYRKPVIYDECKYEGDIPQGWGSLTAREMTQRFWLGTLSGCYVGHGETYRDPQDIIWWAKGGVLHGQSPARIASCSRRALPKPAAADGNDFTKRRDMMR